MCSELVIGNANGLFDTGHALSDFKVNPTVRASNAYKVVLVNNFGWKDVEGKLHILEKRHRSAVVEVLDVKGQEACIGRGQSTVDQDLRCGQTRAFGGGLIGKIEFVTTNCAPNAMNFGLVGTEQRIELGVGPNTSSWDAGLGNEEYCICDGGHARANALCKLDGIVGKGADPHVFVGSADKMGILKGADGDFFSDVIAFTVAVLLGIEEKKCGIGKEGASADGRGKLRSGRKLRIGRNQVRAKFREGEPRERAKWIAAAGNRFVVFRGNAIR